MPEQNVLTVRENARTQSEIERLTKTIEDLKNPIRELLYGVRQKHGLNSTEPFECPIMNELDALIRYK